MGSDTETKSAPRAPDVNTFGTFTERQATLTEYHKALSPEQYELLVSWCALAREVVLRNQVVVLPPDWPQQINDYWEELGGTEGTIYQAAARDAHIEEQRSVVSTMRNKRIGPRATQPQDIAEGVLGLMAVFSAAIALSYSSISCQLRELVTHQFTQFDELLELQDKHTQLDHDTLVAFAAVWPQSPTALFECATVLESQIS
jgi:hypothetical protein